MLRKSLYCILIIFVCSVSIFQNICHANITDEEIFQGHGQTWNAWDLAYKKMDAKYQIMQNNYNTFSGAKSVVEKLISIWKSHHEKLKKSQIATVENVTNAFITVIGAIIPGPGTATTTANVVNKLPAAFATYSAAKSAADTFSITFDMDKHQKALSASLSTMDGAFSTLTQTHPVYKRLYNEYLEACANHILIRSTNFNRVYTAEEIDSAVNTPPYDTDGWYHGSESQGEHVIYARGSWSYSDLPKKYPCEGEGGQNDPNDRYRTPSEAFFTHREKCGTAKSFSQLVRESLSTPYLYTTESFIIELSRRSVADGCGDEWYSCDSDSDDQEREHKERICKIEIPQSGGGTNTCGDRFRLCMGHKKDHDESTIWNGKTVHSDTPDSSDDDDDDSTEQDTQGLQTEQTQTPAPSMHACGVHATSESGDHSWVTPACGDITHAGYACQIGSTHTNLQASCTVTNSNGDYCTVTSFYACQYHTHVYPAPPPPTIHCARPGCTDVVSTAYVHQANCAHCSDTIWTCNTSDVARHRLQTCRRDGCGQSWYKCTSAPTCLARPTRTCWPIN